MTTTALKILLTIFCVQVLVKMYVFFFVKYDVRREQLDKSYGNKTSATKTADYVLLGICVVLVSLLYFYKNLEYISFITGLYVGATLIQIYFHHFSDPLPEAKAPKPPISPIKMMSYAIQAYPKKALEGVSCADNIVSMGVVYAIDKRVSFILTRIKVSRKSINKFRALCWYQIL